jgi:DNA replication protein
MTSPGGPKAEGFQGFPSSALATPVPNLFFSHVLPRIESAEELVVALYFFFAQTLKRRQPRYLTLRELQADGVLARTLAKLCGGEDALERGLALAVNGGILLRASAGANGMREPVFAVNTPANRRALGALGSVSLEEPLPPADAGETPGVFALYEQNIGGITPLIAEELQEAEDRYPPEWLREAFREAVTLNKRNWRYIERILQRWETEGPDYEKAGRDPQLEWLERRYRESKQRLRSGRTG